MNDLNFLFARNIMYSPLVKILIKLMMSIINRWHYHGRLLKYYERSKSIYKKEPPSYFTLYPLASEMGQSRSIKYCGRDHISFWYCDVGYGPGGITQVFGIVMWVTVLPRIRRQKFKLFFYTH